MAIKKITAGLIAISIAGSMLTANVSVAGSVPEGYIYYEDFEDSHNSAYDTPTASKGRWSSELADDGDNHYMKYIINTDVEFTGKNGSPYDVRVEGKDRKNPDYPLDRDTWYELGYKFDLNDCKPRFNTFMTVVLGSVQAQTTMQGWNTGINNGMIFLEKGRDDSGAVSTISIKQDDVDGFISTRILFNLHGSTQNDTNFNTNGEAIYYVSYKTKSGSEVNEHRKFTFPSASNTNNEARSSRFFQGISMAEGWNGKPDNGSSFFIDDIYLKERKTYSVTFEKNDGSGETIIGKSDLDGNVILPEVTRAGWEFDGWYSDEEFTEPFDGKVSSNTTAYAKWLKIHTVYFELNGGTGTESMETVTGTIELPKPTKVRHEFVGWYSDAELTEPFDGTGIDKDMTVYAKWVRAYEISFETNGGEPLEPVYAVSEFKDIPTAERIGYRFDGWYRDEELTVPFDGLNITEDIKVYAKWTKKYKISFESYGGGELEPIYTLEDIDISILPIPKKQGSSFENWYIDKGFTELFDGTGIIGDMRLYAKYNNVLFYEDFENSDNSLNEEWMKQLAPNRYEEFIKNGYGIVDDGMGKGNKAFRLAWDSGKLLTIPIEDGGKGLYEVSFKITMPSNCQGLVSMFSPMKGKTAVISVGANGNWMAVGSKRIFSGKLLGKSEGYVNVTYRIDTVNMLASYYADYFDLLSETTVFEEGSMVEYTSTVDSVDNLQLRINNGAGEQGSEIYVDDICVKKIDQPYIERTTPDENEIDVDINPTIRIDFSDKVDKSTITGETLRLVDSDGNDVTVTRDIKTENDKTVVTMKPTNALEYGKEYSLTAELAISKGAYNLKQPYEIKFKTRPLSLEYSTALTDDETGKVINNLASAKGRKVRAALNIRNYAGEETQSCFVVAVLADTADNSQKKFIHSQGSVDRGEEKTVIDAEFDIASDAALSQKIKFYIWSALKNRKVLTDVITIP